MPIPKLFHALLVVAALSSACRQAESDPCAGTPTPGARALRSYSLTVTSTDTGTCTRVRLSGRAVCQTVEACHDAYSDFRSDTFGALTDEGEAEVIRLAAELGDAVIEPPPPSPWIDRHEILELGQVDVPEAFEWGCDEGSCTEPPAELVPTLEFARELASSLSDGESSRWVTSSPAAP